MFNCSWRKGGSKRDDDLTPITNNHTTIATFYSILYPNITLHNTNSTITMLHTPSTPFPNNNATFTSSSTQCDSSNHSPPPTIQHTSFNINSRSPSNSLKSHGNKLCSPLLCNYTYVITNHSIYLLILLQCS